ncbi:glycosyltransferase family 2 protein [Luteimicrobium subarcticum]|uniref:Glycosyl transferase family 2 n=1 Tax=Luteimicrobium subarcticum TaxID=620910 RepID=A0A2M8WT58_9MICO|nr:glycosyltransferase [Luteimicrobium subarcticum]PJI94113.1 glycosyl transferase family 2 [Luteimicrobium subarcticum]
MTGSTRGAGEPLFSVVIPCYNYARFLERAVRSVLDQDSVQVEVIIVDDCSTDDSLRVAQRIADGDGRVRIVVHETNQGHIRTYNDGLAQVGGDLVVLLSADDLLTPGALRRAQDAFLANPDLALIYGPVDVFRDRPTAVSDAPGHAHVISGSRWVEQVCRLATNVIYSPEAIISRSALDAVGPYREDLPHTGDLYYWLQSALHGSVVRLSGPPQAHYRIHDKNMHHTRYSQLADLSERLRTFRMAIPPSSVGLRRAVEKRIASHAVWTGLECVARNESEMSVEFLALGQSTRPGSSSLAQRLLARLVQDDQSARTRRAVGRLCYVHMRGGNLVRKTRRYLGSA